MSVELSSFVALPAWWMDVTFFSHISVCGGCQCDSACQNVACVMCQYVWRVSVHRADDVTCKHDATCLQVMSSEPCNVGFNWKFKGGLPHFSIPNIGLRLDYKSLEADMDASRQQWEHHFDKLWEHMRVLYGEHPWTVPSGDPILLSYCDDGEPILCIQSGQNTLETHP